MAEPRLHIKVGCALPGRQQLISIEVAAGTRARAALVVSGILGAFPEIDGERCQLGVWGQPVSDDYELHDGDRLEICRPLAKDPRQARREAAARGETLGSRPARSR
jgi:hypothetical protein